MVLKKGNSDILTIQQPDLGGRHYRLCIKLEIPGHQLPSNLEDRTSQGLSFFIESTQIAIEGLIGAHPHSRRTVDRSISLHPSPLIAKFLTGILLEN